MLCAFPPGLFVLVQQQIKVIKACVLLYLFQEVLFPSVLKSIILLWAKFLYCIPTFYKCFFSDCVFLTRPVFSTFMYMPSSGYKPMHMWVYVLCGKIALFFFRKINY